MVVPLTPSANITNTIYINVTKAGNTTQYRFDIEIFSNRPSAIIDFEAIYRGKNQQRQPLGPTDFYQDVLILEGQPGTFEYRTLNNNYGWLQDMFNSNPYITRQVAYHDGTSIAVQTVEPDQFTIPLKAGSTVITLTSYFYCSTSVYTFNVTQIPLSNNSHMSVFTFSGFNTFDPNVFVYIVNFPVTTTHIDILTYGTADPGASLDGTWKGANIDKPSFDLDMGTSILVLRVVSSTGLSTTFYTFYISRGTPTQSPSSSSSSSSTGTSSSTGIVVVPQIATPNYVIICQSVGDPHIQTVGFGFPYKNFDCHTVGYVNVVVNAQFGLQVLVQQRRMYTGETPTSNTALEIIGEQTARVHIANGLFSFNGGTPMTRSALMTSVLANTFSAQGLKISASQTPGSVVIEVVNYFMHFQLNFWNNQGSTFFDLFVHVPDTLAPTSGICKYDSSCPTGDVQLPASAPFHPEMYKFFAVDFEEGVFGKRVLVDNPEVTDAIINAACDGLKTVSDFYYNACKYDVQGARNPNIANVLIQGVNTVVTLVVQLIVQNATAHGGAPGAPIVIPDSIRNLVNVNFTSIVATAVNDSMHSNTTGGGGGNGGPVTVAPITVVTTNPPVSGYTTVDSTDLGTNVKPPPDEPSTASRAVGSFSAVLIAGILFVWRHLF
jgi:hypothetical protein